MLGISQFCDTKYVQTFTLHPPLLADSYCKMERRSVACVAGTVSKMSPRFVWLSAPEKAFLPDHDVEFSCMISYVGVAKYISERERGEVPGGQEREWVKKLPWFLRTVFLQQKFRLRKCFVLPNDHSEQVRSIPAADGSIPRQMQEDHVHVLIQHCWGVVRRYRGNADIAEKLVGWKLRHSVIQLSRIFIKMSPTQELISFWNSYICGITHPNMPNIEAFLLVSPAQTIIFNSGDDPDNPGCWSQVTRLHVI